VNKAAGRILRRHPGCALCAPREISHQSIGYHLRGSPKHGSHDEDDDSGRQQLKQMARASKTDRVSDLGFRQGRCARADARFTVKQRRGGPLCRSPAGMAGEKTNLVAPSTLRICGPGTSPIRCSFLTLAPAAKLWADLAARRISRRGAGLRAGGNAGCDGPLGRAQCQEGAFLREALRVTSSRARFT